MEQRLPEPVKLHEEKTKCPACNKETLEVQVYLYQVPIIGPVTMAVGRCSNCGFTFRDVRVAEQKSPQILRLKVTKPEHLNVLVVRAPSATVKIRGLSEEGDLEMKPGPVADGFITTVEGVLHRFKEIVDFLCEDPEVNREKCLQVKRALEDAIDGKRRFELIIEDPEGVSAIASHETIVEPMNIKNNTQTEKEMREDEN
ncbi:ZPR1-related zinc finger protein [Pyrolobus fumarii 1A]|uniref:ZPR1-related zinc finger protein n=1 Tax=Pyrolobus fumarii (strain DSM 11204 / 1A) TaxID=694429 RepID=G0EHJ6_PYRF1|nr:ZPR1 zinc finger domain-containing protein [Pyrolobus fumarii]AEM39349.1 ZPR1-related zinc finger protein [Pyrolobus fumarii 1A]